MTETDLERRLRGALSARAATVTSRDLRPEPAPSRIDRPSMSARWWLPLTAGLAAAAVSITAFALLRPADPVPTPPVAPASPSRPAPSATRRPHVDTTPSVSPPTPSRSFSTAEPTPNGSRRRPTSERILR